MDEKQYCYCPKCESLFRLSEDRMAFSDGLVRCGLCSQIFHAKTTLVEKSADGYIPVLTQSLDKNQHHKNTPVEEIDIWQRTSIATDQPREPENDQEVPLLFIEETDSDQDDMVFDNFLGHAANNDAVDLAFAENDLSHDDFYTADVEDESIKNNNHFCQNDSKESIVIPTFDSLNNHAEELIKDKPHPLQIFLWVVLTLLLVFLLGLQVRLFIVEKYAQSTQYRSYLALFCKVAQCTLPALKDSSLVSITYTQINLHPSEPKGIRVSVKLINEADFSQPFPLLQLTLTDSAGQVIGRRTFDTNKYLLINKGQLMPPHQSTEIYIDLAQPHEKAVGFSVDIVGK